jgi:hypothetical protein
MSDSVRNQKRGVWPWPVSNPTLGITAEEIKAQKPLAPKDPAIQPIPEPGAVEFLNPSTNSEHLRLAPPAAANPMATATGPAHDHFKVRSALEKSKGSTAQDLHRFLTGAETMGLSEERRTQMKTTLAREQAMVILLRGVQEMQERIYAKVIGTSEA